MMTLTIIWIGLPLLLGFLSYLLPNLARAGTVVTAIASMVYGIHRILDPSELFFQLLDNYGVMILSDSLSGYFILMNAVVTFGVTLYCWTSNKSAFFYTQMMVLHGSINAVFIAFDFISLYVALEVISIAAFLLMTYSQTDRAIWVGLRYLLVSNVAMLFYLMGAILIYQANQSFSFQGLVNAPTEAIALIVLGLLVKSGIFVSGLWLPLTHSEVETPVSALLSGVVIKTGVFPLVRFAMLFEALEPVFQILSAATAIMGVGLALFQQDTKRTLALSTISQMGFILVNPLMAGPYALTHGLSKSSMFLAAGNLPSRDFETLRQKPIELGLWTPMAIASLSVMGCPGLAGFGAKVNTLKPLSGWLGVVMTIAAIGTVALLSKFLFLKPAWQSSLFKPTPLWIALSLPLVGLLGLSSLQVDLYTISTLQKTLMTMGVGGLIYWGLNPYLRLKIPSEIEHLDHLIGMMGLVLTLLFWMVLI